MTFLSNKNKSFVNNKTTKTITFLQLLKEYGSMKIEKNFFIEIIEKSEKISLRCAR